MPGKYKAPPSGNLPKKGKRILLDVYESCISKQGKKTDKAKCAKIAWSVVRKKGYNKESYAKI